jgi:hypothetical protein
MMVRSDEDEDEGTGEATVKTEAPAAEDEEAAEGDEGAAPAAKAKTGFVAHDKLHNYTTEELQSFKQNALKADLLLASGTRPGHVRPGHGVC